MLDQKFRDVIEDITRQMGEGMTVFLDKEVGSMKQWDEVRGVIRVCHITCQMGGRG